ncbi:MAG: DoxX family protein [Candidatus Dadabacteria bacterium]|nr:MAG: DoxX family protein [Candidatus Dadabacteria bacterium]
MKEKLKCFLATKAGVELTVARVMLGVVFLPHGLQKTLGLFGGYGFSGTYHHFTGMGMPAVVALLVILGESLGSLGLIFGCITRFCAFGIFMIMAGAIAMVHWQNGFFMNWFGQQAGEGFEYHLLAIGLALTVMIGGAGKYSIDKLLEEKL